MGVPQEAQEQQTQVVKGLVVHPVVAKAGVSIEADDVQLAFGRSIVAYGRSERGRKIALSAAKDMVGNIPQPQASQWYGKIDPAVPACITNIPRLCMRGDSVMNQIIETLADNIQLDQTHYTSAGNRIRSLNALSVADFYHSDGKFLRPKSIGDMSPLAQSVAQPIFGGKGEHIGWNFPDVLARIRAEVEHYTRGESARARDSKERRVTRYDIALGERDKQTLADRRLNKKIAEKQNNPPIEFVEVKTGDKP